MQIFLSEVVKGEKDLAVAAGGHVCFGGLSHVTCIVELMY